LSLVVVWDLANSTPAAAALVADATLWRSLFDLGLHIYRYDKEQKDSSGRLIVDGKGYRPFVESTGLPILLMIDQDNGNVVRHFRLPETKEQILQMVTAVVRQQGEQQ
jgi:hypothetical protein